MYTQEERDRRIKAAEELLVRPLTDDERKLEQRFPGILTFIPNTEKRQEFIEWVDVYCVRSKP